MCKATATKQLHRSPSKHITGQSQGCATENGSPFKMILDYQGQSETLFEGRVSEEHINLILQFADRLDGR